MSTDYVAWGLLVAHLLQHSGCDQSAKPVGWHVSGDAEAGLKLLEAPQSEQDISDDKQTPTLAHHLQGPSDGAHLVVIRLQ
jgi:hypothetical protein